MFFFFPPDEFIGVENEQKVAQADQQSEALGPKVALLSLHWELVFTFEEKC